MSRYEEAFYTPLLSNWSNHESWLEAGSVTTEQRANQIWKQLLREYQQPAIEPAVDEALQAYVARRKQEMNLQD
jgi:trimethylamine--corrinoid protein Co-methyltransferase